MADYYKKILNELLLKAGAKQIIYKKTKDVFENLKSELSAFAEDLKKDTAEKDKSIEVSCKEKGDFEIHLKFGGDTLVFLMHTNIFNFPPEHFVHKTQYVKTDPIRSYCGMIMVYNFLSDSIKYNRVNDIGYMITRIFINKEGKFFAEGKKQFSFLFKEFGNDEITLTNLRSIIHTAVFQAIDFDLLVPPTDLVQEITLMQKLQDTGTLPIKTGKRLGFSQSDEVIEVEQLPSDDENDDKKT